MVLTTPDKNPFYFIFILFLSVQVSNGIKAKLNSNASNSLCFSIFQTKEEKIGLRVKPE